jgi:serine/threonine protein kinase
MQYYTKHNAYPKTKVNFYKFGRLIGKGAFGKVNIGLHVLTGKIVAIKSFNKQNLKSQESKAKIFEEVNLMKKLRHNSLVKILETIETDKYILIIMENIAGGDLSKASNSEFKDMEKYFTDKGAITENAETGEREVSLDAAKEYVSQFSQEELTAMGYANADEAAAAFQKQFNANMKAWDSIDLPDNLIGVDNISLKTA